MEIIKCYFPYDDKITFIHFANDWQKYFIELIEDKELLFKYNIQSRYSYIFNGYGKHDLEYIYKKYSLKKINNNFFYKLEYVQISNIKNIINEISDENRKIMLGELNELFIIINDLIKNIIDEIVMIIHDSFSEKNLKNLLRMKMIELRYLNTINKFFFYGVFNNINLSFISLIKFYDLIF